jgi:hypothetical protein
MTARRYRTASGSERDKEAFQNTTGHYSNPLTTVRGSVTGYCFVPFNSLYMSSTLGPGTTLTRSLPFAVL